LLNDATSTKGGGGEKTGSTTAKERGDTRKNSLLAGVDQR